MIITLQPNTSELDLQKVIEMITSVGWKSTHVKTQSSHYVVGIGTKDFDIRRLAELSGVKDIHRVSDNYKLVSRKWKVNPTVLDLGDEVKIGEDSFALMAGPCSIENEDQVRKTVQFLASQGIKIMRGGAFKPRSSPYSFRGLGIPGLKFFSEIAHEHGIKIISEVLEIDQIEPMYEFVDIYQVGARNSQNFSLLDALGRTDKPILVKRGMSGTLEELLQSAEYIFSAGNEKLLLCERGIRTYENAYRNTLDLNSVPVLKEKSHLPVIVDPSHGIGVRRFVEAMSLAGVMAGADGLLVEIHESPEEALSDGAQSLNFLEAEELFRKVGECVGVREGWG